MKTWKIDVSQKIKNNKTIFGISGRPLGVQQRKIWKIDLEEQKYDEIVVYIPPHILSVSSSFFLGFLGKSVRKCGAREAFLEKYKFKCSSSIMSSVEEGIKDALREGSGLDV